MQKRIEALFVGSPASIQDADARSLFEKNNIHLKILDRSNLPQEELVLRIQSSIDNGVEVLIATGRSVAILEKFNVPVVKLTSSYYNYVTALQRAKKISNRVAFIYWKSKQGVLIDQFLENHGAELHVLRVDDYVQNDIRFRDAIWKRVLNELKAQNIKVVIGTYGMIPITESLDMVCIPVGYDINGILETISDIQYQCRIFYGQQMEYRKVRTILDNLNEGVIEVTKEGKVLDINASAMRICCLSQKLVVGNLSLNKIFSDKIISQKILDGERLLNYIAVLNGTSVVINIFQTTVADHNSPVSIITMHDVGEISDMDRKIRSRAVQGNFYARKTFKDMIGSSPNFVRAINDAQRFAMTESTILIQGETGCGKEIFAQSICNGSLRKGKPFVVVNCGALPQNLIESELFGYVKGAFTGADPNGKAGMFELADQGTIFLDEIGEIPFNVQARLLRVLQEKEVTRIGDDKVTKINVRIIAATNRNLREEIKRGNFRADLYYRLSVLSLYLPPIRERKADILPLIQTEYHRLSGREITFTEAAEKCLLEHPWYGNVREIINFAERMTVMFDGDVADYSDIERFLERTDFQEFRKRRGEIDSDTMHAATDHIFTDSIRREDNEVENNERKILLNCLEKNFGNRHKTAAELGISITTLWRKMKKYSITIG